MFLSLEKRSIGLGLCGFCPFLAMYVTQPLLPLFMRQFDASPSDVAWTVSATPLAVALVAMAAGIWADVHGRKVIIVSAALGLVCPMLLAMTAKNLLALIAWRYAQGLFIPFIFSSALAYIAEESQMKAASDAALYMSGSVFGSVLGRVLAGVVASWSGWQTAFLILSLVLLVGAVAIWILLPKEKNFIPRAGIKAAVSGLYDHLGNRALWAVCAVGFINLFVFIATFTYVAFHLAQPPFRLSTQQLGFVFLLNLFGAIVTPFAGSWMDQVGARRGLLAALGAMAFGLCLTLASSLAVIFCGLALCSMGVFVAGTAATSRLSSVTGSGRSAAAGLYVTAYYGGGAAGGILPGLVWANGGWTACVALSIVMIAISGTLALIFWTDVRNLQLPPVS